MIGSTANAQVKEIIAYQSKGKARNEAGLFVVEGLRLTREVPPEDLVRLYMTEAFAASPAAAAFPAGLPRELVSESVMNAMADTRTPQGVLAVVRQRRCGLSDFGSGPLLVLEHVQDPGNVGTLFRTAEAAGAGGLLLDDGCADPYQPKVVRGTMGAIFRLPFLRCADLPAAVAGLREAGYTCYAAHLDGARYHDEIDYPDKTVYLLGNEGNGLSETLTAAADVKLKIPMVGPTESLNVSVAGAILLYENLRRRRQR